jgi:hypothetical protein
MPEKVSANFLTRFFINRINKKWRKEKIHFDSEDYENLCEAYWTKAKHNVLSIELTEEETNSLVKQCKTKGVTVNSALTMAFVGAQQIILGSTNETSKLAIAGNLRGRLPVPAGEEMGFYAAAVTLDYSYYGDKGFWENAKELNKKVRPLYTNKNLFKEGLTWLYLDPSIPEAINFKKLGKLVKSNQSRYRKISEFSRRNDVVTSIMKREKIESLDKVIMGAAVTNLTRMDFPRTYGRLELDRLIMNPGGAFPLFNINLVLGAVTCSDKLSLLLEYDENRVSTAVMTRIKEKAMELLRDS